MNYFLFNNHIYVSDGSAVTRIEQGLALEGLFGNLERVHICVVDIDVLIASAFEGSVAQKDALLSRKFNEIYPGDYVLQDERINKNLFQVIGIKSEKVKEVYSLIPARNVESFVPYGIAIRRFLKDHQIAIEKPVVFLDDLGDEKLVTVFEGLKLSRTRTIFGKAETEILSEIKRSVINFDKKLGDQKENTEGFIIITNSRELQSRLNGLETGFDIKLLESICPALEGLKSSQFHIKYVLPEEIIRKRKDEELKRRTQGLMASSAVLAAGLSFYFYHQLALGDAAKSYKNEKIIEVRLEGTFNKLDPYIYRSWLQKQKNINYALAYIHLLGSVPISYEINSIQLSRRPSAWRMQAYFFTPDNRLFDEILQRGFLKSALIRDLLIENKPGKYIELEL